jgi:hypothetical protein
MHPPGFFYRPFAARLLLLFLLAVAVAAPPAAAFRLPATGIVKCYDDSSVIDCPAQGEAYYGQDGNSRKGAPLLYVADDEAVTDTATGLVWQKVHKTDAATWQEAVDHCLGLSLAGFGDWRLPTMQELFSLVAWNKDISPYINAAFTSTSGYWPSMYWSADSRADDPTGTAWYIDFKMPSAYSTSKTSSRDVRCVRGAGLNP